MNQQQRKAEDTKRAELWMKWQQSGKSLYQFLNVRPWTPGK